MPEDVLIVGGGFAGLAAGVALAGAGRRVRLLEQKPHLGGRARSFLDPATGSVVDNGQHLFMGCYHSTIRFLSTLGTLDRIRFQPRLMVRFLSPSGRMTALECFGLRSPWHVLLGVLCSRSFSIKEKREVIQLGRLLQTRAMNQGPERLSVRQWLTRAGQSEGLQRNFWDLVCIAALNEDPELANAELFERVLRLAMFTSAADSRLGIARVGLSELYLDAADAYIWAKGGRVECNRNVTALLISEGRCRGVRLASGEEIEAPCVLSAVTSFQLEGLLPGELLRSEPFFAAATSLRPAPIVSVNFWFDRPVADLDFAALRGGTMQWLFNRNRILDANENHVSLVLSGAHSYIQRPSDELEALALRDLGGFLPKTRKAAVRHSLVIKERFATFSPTWEVERVRPPARTPVHGFYLAGDWTATGLPATIESAVQSGYAAATAILGGE